MIEGMGYGASKLGLRSGVFSTLMALVSLAIIAGVFLPQDASATVEDDTTPPLITCPTNITIQMLTPEPLSIPGYPPSTLADFEFIGGSASDDLDLDLDYFYAGPADFPVDVHLVTHTVIDDAGNSAFCIQVINMLGDFTPPVIDCPPDIFMQILSSDPVPVSIPGYPPSTLADFEFIGGSASDDVATELDYFYTGPSSFDIGTTFVVHTVQDGFSNTAGCTQSIEIEVLNQPPVANDVSYEINLGETLEANLFDSASDPDGDSLTAGITQAPSNGVLVLQIPTGAFTYTPSVGFSGVDTFKYKVNDGTEDSNEATVTITVLSPTEQAQNLVEDVDNADLSKTVEKALMGPLKKIVKILEDDNPDNDGAACGKLDEFINTVNAKEAAGQLDPSDADDFRDAAENLQQSLGC